MRVELVLIPTPRVAVWSVSKLLAASSHLTRRPPSSKTGDLVTSCNHAVTDFGGNHVPQRGVKQRDDLTHLCTSNTSRKKTKHKLKIKIREALLLAYKSVKFEIINFSHTFNIIER